MASGSRVFPGDMFCLVPPSCPHCSDWMLGHKLWRRVGRAWSNGHGRERFPLSPSPRLSVWQRRMCASIGFALVPNAKHF